MQACCLELWPCSSAYFPFIENIFIPTTDNFSNYVLDQDQDSSQESGVSFFLAALQLFKRWFIAALLPWS